VNPRPSRAPARCTPRRPKAARPWLEALEHRCLPSFLPPVSYPAGSTPQAVTTADVNGDGKLDLVTANAGSNTVSVLLGNGNGTFQAAKTYGVGSAPNSVAVGDFNRDGKLDLVTANDQDNTVSVLLGNGDGTFQPAKNYATGQSPVSVAVGDFNGKLDIVTANYGDNTVSVLLGNGDGTFGAAESIVLDAPPTAVAVGDLTADGRLDLAVTTAAIPGIPGQTICGYGWGYAGYYGCISLPPQPGKPAAVHVLLGNGAGTFTGENSYTLPGGQPTSLVVADLNADGKLDVVTANQGDSTVSVLLGNGDGTFEGPRSFSTGSDYTDSVAAADLNRDGKFDLVTADQDSTVSVLLGNGDGTFGPNELFPVGGSYVTSVAAGDFNGDGFPDLGVTIGLSNDVSVLLNAADWPSFQVNGFPSSTTAGAAGTFTVTVKDPNGSTDAGYTGTVQFMSSDAQAVLPTSYTFTAADAGMHTFSATLKTAGTQSLRATDGSVTGSEAGITVTPAAANRLEVTAPAGSTAGSAFDVTVTALDPYNNVASGYRGTVHFTSSDARAVLSANYAFTAADAGVHTFSATLKTAGTQAIAATDTVNAGLSGTDGGIAVNPAPASKFIITAPSSVNAGAAFSLTLTVEDAYGNVVTGYTGTVHFSSTDNKATLPSNYTFTAADKGIHTFTGLVLRKKGYQKITITDTLNTTLTGSALVDVL
jgi:hypothetical protein